MTLESLAMELRRRFRPEAATGIDMLLRLNIADATQLLFRVRNGLLEFTTIDQRHDVTFYFDSLATANALIRGEADAIDAFMHERFRADGYLMMAFRLMELFGSTSLPPTPID
jgi:putative sterol carrier protein